MEPPQHQHPSPTPQPQHPMATGILSTHHYASPSNTLALPQQAVSAPPFARLLPPLPQDSDANAVNVGINTPETPEDPLTASASIVTTASSAAPSPNGNNHNNGNSAFLPPISMNIPLTSSPGGDRNRNNNNGLILAGNCNNNFPRSESAPLANNNNTTTANANASANGNGNSATNNNGTAIPAAIYDIAKLLAASCTIFQGKVYNVKGHPICGVLNQHDRPCHRIGRCPFHYYSSPVSKDNVCNGTVDRFGTSILTSSSSTGILGTDNVRVSPPKKMQYKHGWSKEEHYLFLRGLSTHGRGAWKQIAGDVRTRNPTQVQSHAQKFYLRQKQKNKNKRSIHDLTLESPEMIEIAKNFNNLSIDNGNNNGHINLMNNNSQNNAAAIGINPIQTIPVTVKNQPSVVSHTTYDDLTSMFANTNTNLFPFGNNNAGNARGIGNVNGTGNGINLIHSHQPNNNQRSEPWYGTQSPISTVNTANRSPVGHWSNGHNVNSTTTATNAYSIAADTKRSSDALLDAATALPIRPVGSDALPIPIPLPISYGTTQQHHDINVSGHHYPETHHQQHGATNTAPYVYGNANNGNAGTGHSYEDIAHNTRYDTVNVGIPSTNVLMGSDPANDGVSALLRGGITKSNNGYRRNKNNSGIHHTNISHSNSFEPLPPQTHNNNTHLFNTGELHEPTQHHHNHSHRGDVGALLGTNRSISANADQR